jgi:mRNA interferase MazF
MGYLVPDFKITQEVFHGSVWWANLDPTLGREQAGRRPVVVIAGNAYLRRAGTLAIVLPTTSRDRGWPNHVRLKGNLDLPIATFAITEQPRTITREQLRQHIGELDRSCMQEISVWLRDFLDLG